MCWWYSCLKSSRSGKTIMSLDDRAEMSVSTTSSERWRRPEPAHLVSVLLSSRKKPSWSLYPIPPSVPTSLYYSSTWCSQVPWSQANIYALKRLHWKKMDLWRVSWAIKHKKTQEESETILWALRSPLHTYTVCEAKIKRSTAAVQVQDTKTWNHWSTYK